MVPRMQKLLPAFTLFIVIALTASACAAGTTTQVTQVPPVTQAPSGTQAPLPITGGTPAATAGASQTQAPATTQQATTAPSPNATAAVTQPAGAPGPAAKNPNIISEATAGDAESLDPAWAYDTASGEVIFNVYETLLFPKKNDPNSFVPMLATKWDVSSDGMTYTFTIRKGVKFQDGQDLTPEDVAYSFWRGMIQDRSGGPQWILLQPFFGLDVQSFEADVVQKQFNGDWTKAAQAVEQAVTFDNQAGTVTMHLKQPFGPMLQVLTGSWASIVSKPWVIQQGGWDGDPAKAQKFHDPSAEKDPLFKVMNGTGPYKLDRWSPGQEIDLVANDNYWLKQPLWDGGPSGTAKVQRVIIKQIPEWGTRFATFKTGDADMAYVPRQYTSQVDPLVSQQCDATGNCKDVNPQGSLRVYQGLPTVQSDVIFFNQDVNTTGGSNTIGSGKLDGNGIPANFFSDIHVRKAFNYCFDWNTYIQQVWNGEATQAYGPIIQGELGFDPNQQHYSYDPAKCAAEFKASTLTSDSGKSLWDTGFYLQYVYNTGNDQRKTAGEILAQDLQQVNPKFHLAVVDEPWPVLLKDQVDGRMPIFMLGWLEDYHDPQDWVVPFLSSGGTYASTQHFDPTVQSQIDQLITKGIQDTDQKARTQDYQQLQKLTYDNALDIFLVQPQGRHYEQMWVHGWYYNPIYPGVYFYSLSKGG